MLEMFIYFDIRSYCFGVSFRSCHGYTNKASEQTHSINQAFSQGYQYFTQIRLAFKRIFSAYTSRNQRIYQIHKQIHATSQVLTKASLFASRNQYCIQHELTVLCILF